MWWQSNNDDSSSSKPTNSKDAEPEPEATIAPRQMVQPTINSSVEPQSEKSDEAKSVSKKSTSGCTAPSTKSSTGIVTDRSTIDLEVLVPAPDRIDSTDATDQLPTMITHIVCSTRAARLSPVLAKVIDQLMPVESTGASVDSRRQACPSALNYFDPPAQPTITAHGKAVNGRLVVRLSGSSACNHSAVTRLVTWLSYHILDSEFENSCRFDHFDQDEHEREQQRLAELPCYFDWSFITELGGGESLSVDRRADLFDVIVLADQLGLESLVLLAGKYICASVKDKSVKEVRTLLGLVNDFTEAEEKRIRDANEAILKLNTAS